MSAAIRLRRGEAADAEALAHGVLEGVAGYVEFAPAGWAPPALDEEVAYLRGRLLDPAAYCIVAEDTSGAIAGQITVLPAAIAAHPVDDPELGHVSDLFVAREHWGGGLATMLHAAALEVARARGWRELRLFVADGQARAKRFYAREGWTPAGEPFDDPVPGLRMVEYRRAVG
jgi:GNAT superfamily N-acetyltransferase